MSDFQKVQSSILGVGTIKTNSYNTINKYILFM